MLEFITITNSILLPICINLLILSCIINKESRLNLHIISFILSLILSLDCTIFLEIISDLIPSYYYLFLIKTANETYIIISLPMFVYEFIILLVALMKRSEKKAIEDHISQKIKQPKPVYVPK